MSPPDGHHRPGGPTRYQHPPDSERRDGRTSATRAGKPHSWQRAPLNP